MGATLQEMKKKKAEAPDKSILLQVPVKKEPEKQVIVQQPAALRWKVLKREEQPAFQTTTTAPDLTRVATQRAEPRKKGIIIVASDLREAIFGPTLNEHEIDVLDLLLSNTARRIMEGKLRA